MPEDRPTLRETPLAVGRRAFLGLGANLGDRQATMQAAVKHLTATDGVTVVRKSPLYASEAHVLDETTERFTYLNAVVEVCTTHSPDALLDVCLVIERNFGRDRVQEARWAPRTLDLDVLYYEGEMRQTRSLTIPHPRMAERRFVLQPLADLAPDLWLPAPYESTVASLLADCRDQTLLTCFSKTW